MSKTTLRKRISLTVVTALMAGVLTSVATGPVATDVNTPAVSAATTVSEIRLRIVVFDIFFLSLVRIRNFLTLARRSFGSSNPISLRHTRVMPPGDGNLVIRWELAHHLLVLIPEALKSQSQVDPVKAVFDLHIQ